MAMVLLKTILMPSSDYYGGIRKEILCRKKIASDIKLTQDSLIVRIQDSLHSYSSATHAFVQLSLVLNEACLRNDRMLQK